MRAKKGNRIVVRGRKVGDSGRSGVIVDVRGSDGGPPYLVRWDNDAGEHLIYPGSDALISASDG
jgi:hypothetical protein